MAYGALVIYHHASMHQDYTTMTQLLQKAIKALSNLDELPEEEQNTIASQIIKVLELNKSDVQYDPIESSRKKIKERTAGLELGTITIADDFDEPLPDSFWLGEE